MESKYSIEKDITVVEPFNMLTDCVEAKLLHSTVFVLACFFREKVAQNCFKLFSAEVFRWVSLRRLCCARYSTALAQVTSYLCVDFPVTGLKKTVNQRGRS